MQSSPIAAPPVRPPCCGDFKDAEGGKDCCCRCRAAASASGSARSTGTRPPRRESTTMTAADRRERGRSGSGRSARRSPADGVARPLLPEVRSTQFWIGEDALGCNAQRRNEQGFVSGPDDRGRVRQHHINGHVRQSNTLGLGGHEARRVLLSAQ